MPGEDFTLRYGHGTSLPQYGPGNCSTAVCSYFYKIGSEEAISVDSLLDLDTFPHQPDKTLPGLQMHAEHAWSEMAGVNQYGVLSTGYLAIRQTAIYTFVAWANDTSSAGEVWVEGLSHTMVKVADTRHHPPYQSTTGTVAVRLKAGRFYQLQIRAVSSAFASSGGLHVEISGGYTDVSTTLGAQPHFAEPLAVIQRDASVRKCFSVNRICHSQTQIHL